MRIVENKGRMRYRARHDRAGFTLVEMLVSVALGAIILAVTVTAFAQGSGVSKLAHAKTEALHNTMVALEFLERDLQSACIEPDGNIFRGVSDTTLGGFDNNDDGDVDEDGDNFGVPDPEDFKADPGHERHGLELLTPTHHVLYYLTRDAETLRGYEMGRLVRVSLARGGSENSWLGLPGPGHSEEASVLCSGITQFRVLYYSEGSWQESWDSQGSDLRKLPEVVEVRIRVVDDDGFLERPENNPVVMRRLIALPKD